MRRTALFLSVLLLAATASGQYLLRREPIAGPWGRLYAYDMAFDSVDNRLFIGGAVIDASTNEVVEMLDVGSDAMGYNPIANKVYAGGADVSVIDAATLDILAVLPYQWEMTAAPGYAVNTRENKVYLCLDHSLMVVDGATDSVLAFHAVDAPVGVVYSPGSNKAYCQDKREQRVLVVDGVTDSVTGEIEVGERFPWQSLCHVPAGDKVYCGAVENPGFVIIDCATDSIVRILDLPGAMLMSYNPALNRVYMTRGGRGLHVMDCATDSLLGILVTPGHEEITSTGWGAGGNRVYVTRIDWRLGIVDCPADTLVAWTFASRAQWPAPVCYNPVENVYYCLDADRGVVVVVDCAGDSILANIRLSGFRNPANLGYNPMTNRLYYLDGGSGAMMTLSGATGIIQTARQVGIKLSRCLNGPGAKVYTCDLAAGQMLVVGGGRDTVVGLVERDSLGRPFWCDTLRRRLYCHCGQASVGVIDTDADTFVKAMPAIPRMYEFCPVRRGEKAYVRASWYDSLHVLDLVGDSLLPSIPLPAPPIGAPAYSYIQDRLYCPLSGGSIAVIDPGADTLLAEIPTPECVAIWNAPTDELYVAFGSRWVMVFDCATNQLVASVDAGYSIGSLYSDTRTGHVYCSGDSGLAVVNSYTGEVQATLDVPGAWGFCPGMPGRLFAMSGDSVVATIGYPTGVGEWSVTPGRTQPGHLPTILRGPELARMDCRVVDALGRDVTDERGGLAPGVYFLCPASGIERQASRVTKVIVQR